MALTHANLSARLCAPAQEQSMTPNEARAAIAAAIDPMLGRPLGPIVQSVSLEPGLARVGLVYPFPVGGYGPLAQATVAGALGALGWHGRTEVELRAEIACDDRRHTIGETDRVLVPLGLRRVVARPRRIGSSGRHVAAAGA